MVEDGSILVPLEDLAKNPYKDLLAYPNPSDESVESRIRQLKSLGIEGLEFEGPLRMGKLSVLGKGVVGLVFRGIADNRRVAGDFSAGCRCARTASRLQIGTADPASSC